MAFHVAQSDDDDDDSLGIIVLQLHRCYGGDVQYEPYLVVVICPKVKKSGRWCKQGGACPFRAAGIVPNASLAVLHPRLSRSGFLKDPSQLCQDSGLPSGRQDKAPARR